jgi:shikimate dehydrogenase
MPFKEAVIPLVDRLEPSAEAIASVNTIVNDGGVLTAANTDFEAVRSLLAAHAVPAEASVLVRGSGGMAKAVVAAFRDAGFARLTVLARNPEAGRALAEAYDYRFVDRPPASADVLVNVTPLGMTGPSEDELAFEPTLIDRSSVVFDVVAVPAETPLLRAARAAGVRVIAGVEVHAQQAALQFERYTGVRPTADQVAGAHAFARE